MIHGATLRDDDRKADRRRRHAASGDFFTTTGEVPIRSFEVKAGRVRADLKGARARGSVAERAE
jgi:hypothetical protein